MMIATRELFFLFFFLYLFPLRMNGHGGRREEVRKRSRKNKEGERGHLKRREKGGSRLV